MLMRLAALVGFVLVWSVCALGFPILFWVVGGLIVGAAIFQGVRSKQFGSGNHFFIGVGVATLLLATGGFFSQRGGSKTPDEVAAADDEKPGDDAKPADEGTPTDGKPADGEAKALVDGEAAAPGGEEAPGAPVDAKTAIKNATMAAKKSCKSLEALAEAWKQLSAIPKADKAYAKAKPAAAALEKCRKLTSGALVKGAEKTKAKERDALVKETNKALAAAGMKLMPKLAGKTKNTLALKGPKLTPEQIDAAFAGDPADATTVLGKLQAAGFAKVTVTSGKTNRTFELQPPSDTAAINEQLEALGLSQPLKMP